ncbi:YybH family protein [Maribacter sp. 2-571]|uniref:YybH family protein n=1 Tax=Maribacter sp. 2-571 TaxID=3417569 RepID=UPI003D3437DC
MKTAVLTVLAGLMMLSCTNRQTAELSQEGEAQLLETSREWSKSFSTEAYFSFIGEDGIMMAPDQPLLQGHEKIRKVLSEFQSIPGFNVTWEPQQAFVSESGDLGYTIDKMLVSFEDENGSTVKQFEKVVSIWKKNEEGVWKMAVDVWNTDPTLTAIDKQG